ncbi:hypothetical protein ABFA07_015575 [Porites harrisoni]
MIPLFLVLLNLLAVDHATSKHVGKYTYYFCRGKPNGNYRDPDTCYGYIACSNGITYKMPCPAGLMYNAKKDQCDYPKNVHCPWPWVNICHGKPDGHYKDPDNCYGYIACVKGIAQKFFCPYSLRFDPKTQRCYYPDFVTCDNFCDGKRNGNYEDPDTCYGFISCSTGIAYKMACPAGLRYNAKKDQCDWPKNVPCYPINGGWTHWTAWFPCSVSCGRGIQISIRYCTNPYPARGGNRCVGPSVKRQICNPQRCPFTCWGKPNGNYKDPGNCYGYISCSNQIAYYMPCPAGLKYNEVKDKCDWPKNVNCY